MSYFLQVFCDICTTTSPKYNYFSFYAVDCWEDCALCTCINFFLTTVWYSSTTYRHIIVNIFLYKFIMQKDDLWLKLETKFTTLLLITFVRINDKYINPVIPHMFHYAVSFVCMITMIGTSTIIHLNNFSDIFSLSNVMSFVAFNQLNNSFGYNVPLSG